MTRALIPNHRHTLAQRLREAGEEALPPASPKNEKSYEPPELPPPMVG
jgi:hypothetical protein